MPVEFLSAERQARYGRYSGEPTPADLARSFYLDDRDRELIAARRGDHNRLGVAVQLCIVRYPGTFLPDPTAVPSSVIAYVAAQVGVADTSCLLLYGRRETTWREHAGEIRRAYEYRDFHDPAEHLEKLDEPASLLRLRDGVNARLPRVDLPDVILEVQRWTDFADAFTHISEGNARVHDLTTSICAVLLAEACNIGLEPLIRPDVPALTRGRLEWVQQNYVRAETIARANALLVEAQARIALAHAWGGGDVVSADGCASASSCAPSTPGRTPRISAWAPVSPTST